MHKRTATPSAPPVGLLSLALSGSRPRSHGSSALATLLLCVLAGSAVAAESGAIVADSALWFRSTEQSVWGADEASFTIPIALQTSNINLPNINVGGIVTRPVNNPLHDAWTVLYDSTYATTYGAVYAANYPGCLIAAFGNTSQANACASAEARSLATTAARATAGPEPAETYPEKNGGRLTGDTKLISGLTGGITADGGSVFVEYLPNVRTTLGNTDAAPGERMTLRSVIVTDDARIHTTDIGLGISLAAYEDFASHLKLEAYLLNVGGPVQLTNFGNGRDVQPLFELTASGGGITLDPLDLGAITVAQSLTKQFGVSLQPPDSSVEITAPVFEITAGPPDTSVDPDETTRVGAAWRNGVEPEDRTGGSILGIGNSTPLQGTEFARVAVDLDSVSLMFGLPLGARAAVNTPPLGIPTIMGAEGNLLDFDLDTYWALQASYEFLPKLQVTYRFSETVEIERENGDRMLAAAVTVTPGEVITFFRPAGGVDVVSEFSLGGDFTNLTDFEVQFGLSLALLELYFDGVLFSTVDGLLTWSEIVDLPNRIVVATGELAIGDPIHLGRAGSPNGVKFALDGFVIQDGPSFRVVAVPEPSTWFMLIAGLLMLGAAARRKHGA